MEFLAAAMVSSILLALAWLVYHFVYVRNRTKKITTNKLRIFADLIRKLGSDKTIMTDDLAHLVRNPSTRHALFGILERFDKSHLFPPEYLTTEKSAESFMVNWLEFPTELDGPPERIELFTKILLPEEPDLEYFVFKFKQPSSKSKQTEEWMLGVVGPFDTNSKPYDIPARVFSRFNVVGAVSPLEEARWVHNNINKG
jgi:hypothetical protein